MADDNKLFAFLAVFLGIIGFLIAILAKKDDKYVMYYAKQSLVLFIAYMLVYLLGLFIPIIGWFVILPIGGLVMLVLWIMGLVYSLSGEMKPVPLVGKFAEKFNF